MKKYKCYIVDDEPLALNVIEQHLGKFARFEVCGKTTDAVEALSQIRALQPDLLFLDIQMPEITGLELIESMQHKPEVIITTAYREYAVEGFDLDVLDYLVKPIPFKRFVKAIDKFLGLQADAQVGASAEPPVFIMVKADRKTLKIQLDDILYIEGIKDYVRIVSAGQKIMTKTSIGNFFEELPADRFIRVHKSFIVGRNKITAWSAQNVELGGVEIPVGRTYKEAFLREMENV